MPNQNILRQTALNNPKMHDNAAVEAAEDSIPSCIKISVPTVRMDQMTLTGI